MKAYPSLDGVYISVWYEIQQSVEIPSIIILREVSKSRGKMISNPEPQKPKEKPYLALDK